MKVFRAGQDDFYLFPWLDYQPTWKDTEYQNHIRVWKKRNGIYSEVHFSTIIELDLLLQLSIDLLDTLNKLRYYFENSKNSLHWIETADILSGKWKPE